MTDISKICAILLATLLVACATSQPVVQTDQAPGVDLARFRTYTWVEEPNTQSPIVREKLMRAVDAQLAAKGMQRVPDGDVALVGHIATREDVSYNNFSVGLGLGSWGNSGGVGVGTDTGRSVPKTKLVGSLIFDMYDAKTKQAIWRGTVSGDVPQDPATIDAAIARYIPQMFANFPSR